MATVFFKGIECNTYGMVPAVGAIAPDFQLTTKDLAEVKLSDFAGKRLIITSFPSLDTPVCALQVQRFNAEAAKLHNVAVLCVSMDLPFAEGRFCAAHGIDNITVASAFRSPRFREDYGLEIIDGPLKGLLARAAIVLDTDGRVIYSQLVEEITHEPDYDAILKILREEK